MIGNFTQLSSYDFPSSIKGTTVSVPKSVKVKQQVSTEMFISQILAYKGQTIKDVKISFCFTDF